MEALAADMVGIVFSSVWSVVLLRLLQVGYLAIIFTAGLSRAILLLCRVCHANLVIQFVCLAEPLPSYFVVSGCFDIVCCVLRICKQSARNRTTKMLQVYAGSVKDLISQKYK